MRLARHAMRAVNLKDRQTAGGDTRQPSCHLLTVARLVWRPGRDLSVMPTDSLPRIIRLATVAAAAALLLTACGTIAMPPTIDTATAPKPHLFNFTDGGNALYYMLDKRLTAPDFPADLQRGMRSMSSFEPQDETQSACTIDTPWGKQADPQAERQTEQQTDLQTETNFSTFVFFISGSGCTSLQYFLLRYFDGLEGESGPIRIFMLQKRFIEARTWGRISGCSREFMLADHPSQWLADQSAFITAQLDAALANNISPARIVIAGVSEGAEIVPLLARLTPAVTHAVLIGNGGMPPMQAYRLQLSRHGLSMPVIESIDSTAAKNATNVINVTNATDATTATDATDRYASTIVAGHTMLYWSELEQLDPTRDLLTLSVPVWVAMGEDDEAVPIASAHYLEQEFTRHGRSNLVLKIYPGADHALVTNSRTNTADFWFEFDRAMQK